MNRDESRSILTIVAVVLLVLVLLPAIFMGLMMGGGIMYGGMMGNWNWGGNPWGWLLMLVFWVLVIGGVAAIVIWAISRTHPTDSGAGNRQDAMEILKQRYARGEIDREQFEQIRRDLTTDSKS